MDLEAAECKEGVISHVVLTFSQFILCKWVCVRYCSFLRPSHVKVIVYLRILLGNYYYQILLNIFYNILFRLVGN
jgi:hypothetical protein